MWVPVDSHPLSLPEHVVGPGGYAMRDTVASHLNMANSPYAPKDLLPLQELAAKGLSASNCGRPQALKMLPSSSSCFCGDPPCPTVLSQPG